MKLELLESTVAGGYDTDEAADEVRELRRQAQSVRLSVMRAVHTIDSELRLLVAVRWSIREQCGEPSSRLVDELLDERAALSTP